MPVELATAYVTLVPSLQGAQGKIAEEFGREGEAAGGLFEGGMNVAFGAIIAAAAVAAAAVGAVFVTGFSEAAEAEVANAQLTNAIQNTGNAANVSVAELNDLASSIQGYSGQTDDSIAATERLLLRFQNIKNVGPDDIFNQATIAAADMAAVLGGDASSQAQKLGRALEDPAAGLTSLNRSGVFFTEQQKAQVEAMVAAGDVLGAQKVIIGQVQATYAGSAAAFGGTWSGTVERVKRAFEDLTQNVMEGLLPIFKPIAEGLVTAMAALAPVATVVGDALSSGVGKAIEFIGPLFSQIGSVLGPLAAQFLELWSTISPLSLIFQAIQPFLPQLLDAFMNLASVVGGALGQAFTTLMPVMQQLAGILVGVLGQAISVILPVVVQLINILGPVISSVLTALMPIIVQLAGIVGQLFQAFLPLLAPILGLLPPIAELVGALLPVLIDLFTSTLSPILSLVSVLLTAMMPSLKAIIEVLAFLITGVVEVITWFVNLASGSSEASNQLSSIWSGVLSFFGGIWDGIVGFFSTGIARAIGFVRGLPGQVLAAVGNLGGLLVGAGQDLIQGFINGIGSMIGAVGNAIGGVMDFVAGFFPHSPAEHGPFSGNGWRELGRSGLAIADQFNSSLTPANFASPFGAFRVPTGSGSSADLLEAAGTQPVGAFNNYGTIQVTDEAQLAEEVAIRQRRALALTGLNRTVVT